MDLNRHGPRDIDLSESEVSHYLGTIACDKIDETA